MALGARRNRRRTVQRWYEHSLCDIGGTINSQQWFRHKSRYCPPPKPTHGSTAAEVAHRRDPAQALHPAARALQLDARAGGRRPSRPERQGEHPFRRP